MQLLRDLIDFKIAKKGNISLINGINFGCQYEGYYDHPLLLFSSISQTIFNDPKMNKDRKAEFFVAVNQIKFDEQIMNFLMNISSKSDLSPTGFIAIL